MDGDAARERTKAVPMSTAKVVSEAFESSGTGGIRAAIEEMVRETVRAHEQRARREAVARLIRVTDGMIAEVEELNLREVTRIPACLEMRAQLVFEMLGFEPKPPLSAQPTPTRLIDTLFDAQQLLFDLKVGEDPDGLRWAAGGRG